MELRRGICDRGTDLIRSFYKCLPENLKTKSLPGVGITLQRDMGTSVYLLFGLVTALICINPSFGKYNNDAVTKLTIFLFNHFISILSVLIESYFSTISFRYYLFSLNVIFQAFHFDIICSH